MTRKDYKRLAEELAITLRNLDDLIVSKGDSDSDQRTAFQIAVECMCDAMKRDNPRFDRSKFLEAVGI